MWSYLREGCLGRGLVVEVPAGQVDVVAGADRQKERVFVDPDVSGGHNGKEGLQNLNRECNFYDLL